MNLWEKLKKIKKKWYLLLLALLIIGAAGGAAAHVRYEPLHEQQKAAQASAQAYREVYTDLLYLENFATLKVTPDQAKEILPLIDQLTAADSSTQAELAKQVYSVLTPLQYQALLSHQGSLNHESTKNGRDDRDKSERHGFDQDSNGRENFDGKDIQSPREQALEGVVSKMLKDRSLAGTNPTTP